MSLNLFDTAPFSQDALNAGCDGPISGSGAMTAKDEEQRSPPYTGFLVLITAAEVTLNIPPLAGYMPWRPSWCLVALPVLLVGGLIGGIRSSRLPRAVGWIGVCLGVCVYVLGMLLEEGVDLQYAFGEGIYPPSDGLNHLAFVDFLGRWVLKVALSALLIRRFAKLAGKSEVPIHF